MAGSGDDEERRGEGGTYRLDILGRADSLPGRDSPVLRQRGSLKLRGEADGAIDPDCPVELGLTRGGGSPIFRIDERRWSAVARGG